MIYGIDIGGTKIETALFDGAFDKRQSWRVTTPTVAYDAFLNTIVEQVKKADLICQLKGIIGIGMPGLIDYNEHSLSANIPCANGRNIRADLQVRLNRPIFIENDCRCFALSEAVGGAGNGFKRVYGAIIGTGAAGGLCINGAIDTGRNGILGEYGHIAMPAFLQQKYGLQSHICGCGMTDCMEWYVAGPGLSRIYQHMHQQSPDAIEINRQFQLNDLQAIDVFACYMDLLGYTFASIIHSHDPDIIVIGGGISKVDHIINNLPGAIKPYTFRDVVLPSIVKAQFGDASGARGAAILAKSSTQH
jgi:N-acetylglucosamine kinase